MKEEQLMQSPAQSTLPVLKQEKVWRYVCIPTAVVGFCFICVLTALLLIRRSDEQIGVPQTEPFCCPEEVEELARTVNRGIDPCKDFHAYMCSRVIKVKLSPGVPDKDHFLNEIRQGRDVYSSPAKTALWNYEYACFSSISHLDSMLEQLASAVIEEFHIRTHMDEAEVSRFLLTTNLVYGVNNVLAIDASTTPPIIYPRKILELCLQCVKTVAAVFNTRFLTNITEGDITEFGKSFVTIDLTRTPNEVRTSTLRDLFPSLPDVDWHQIQDEAPTSLGDGSLVLVPDIVSVRDVLKALSLDASQPTSIAYMVANAAVGLFVELALSASHETNETAFSAAVSHICVQHILSLHNLWKVLIAQELTDKTKDEHIRDIHSRLVIAVSAAALGVFSDSDKKDVKPTLQSLKLVLPRQYSLGDLPLFNTSADFGLNYFRGLRYEATARRERVRRNLPKIEGDDMLVGNALYVTPSYYARCNFDSVEKFLLNMPVVGIPMAGSMWRFLLSYEGWSSETLSNIRSFYECFHKNYLGGRPSNRIGKETSDTALAVRATLAATDRSKWYEQRFANHNMWSLSHGELFYMRYASSVCVPSYSPAVVQKVNIPLRYADDFAKTFSCSSSTAMARRSDC